MFAKIGLLICHLSNNKSIKVFTRCIISLIFNKVLPLKLLNKLFYYIFDPISLK